MFATAPIYRGVRKPALTSVKERPRGMQTHEVTESGHRESTPFQPCLGTYLVAQLFNSILECGYEISGPRTGFRRCREQGHCEQRRFL